MSQSIEDRVRWTTADIELLPDNGNRVDSIGLQQEGASETLAEQGDAAQ